jgi:FG-GAP-like repeat
MRSTILATIVAAILAFGCTAQAQFFSTTQYDNGTNFALFQHADVNNDGKTDIVGIPANNSGLLGDTIMVLLGTGTGGFGAPISTAITGVDAPPSGSGFSLFLLGDFNGDGRVDVAVFGVDHTTGQNAVAVMLGNGNGTFQTGVETVLGGVLGTPQFGTCSGTAADFNDDGKVDIAFLPSNGGAISLVVLPGNGNGTFSSPITTAVSGGICLAPGDFNNDKKLDLAVATEGGVDFVLLGKGNGTFESPIGLGKGGSNIVASKLTSSSDLDLVAVLPNDPGSITVFLGDGTGHFPTKHTYATPANASLGRPLVVRDLNGDHLADIVYIATAGFNDVVGILLNNGDGSFTPTKLYAGDGSNLPSAPSGLLAGDFNGDGKIDLAFPNAAGGISVMLGNGNGTFQGNLAMIGGAWTNPIVAEFTGTTPDVLFASPSSNELLVSNGDGTFTTMATGCGFGSVTGDFNKDGKLDLAGNTSLSGVPAIGVCLGNGNGTFTETSGHFDQGITHGLLVTGDFNNDGKLDLAASDANGISVLLGNGDGSFQSGIPTAVNQSSPTFTAGDFNGDGKLDVAAITGSGLSVFLGKGNGTFETPLVSTCSCNTTPENITALDLNGDGKLDLLVISGGNAIVLLGKGNGTFQAPVRYTLSKAAATGAAIADFNGDGKLDIAVGINNFNGAGIAPEGWVAVLFGDGTGKFSAPTLFNAGGSFSRFPYSGLATADFNGDGKPDLVLSVGGLVVTFLNQE